MFMKFFLLFLGFIFSLLLFSSCHKKKILHEYLTNDSVSMWDMPIMELQVIDDDSSYFERTISFLFYKDLTCDVFNLGMRDRHARRIGPKVNVTGKCNKWEMLNDSVIKMNCVDSFVVKIINRDTLYLFDALGVKKHEMYRVSKPWNINEESVEIRDKLIESGEYLSSYLYY